MKQDTPDALITAARRLFARHGYDGASVRAITNAARTNLGAVTYHFGSKRRLYEVVLENCAQPLADAAVAAAAGPGTCIDRIDAVVRTYFDYLARNPDVGQLMLQELVLGRTPPAATLVPIRRILQALSELVQEGQASGAFRPGDAHLMALSIVSQPVHMTLVRRALRALAGIDLEDPGTREQVAQHASAFACGGLCVQEGNT